VAERKVRVCHIVSGNLWAGAEVQVFNLITARRYREKVEPFCILLNRGVLEEKLRSQGISVEVVPEREINFPKLMARVYKLIQGHHYDLIHSHRYKENFIAVCVSKLGGSAPVIKTLYGIREIVTGWRRVKRVAYYFADSLMSRWFINRTIVVTQDMKDKVSTLIPRSKIDVIENSIDTKTFERIWNSKRSQDPIHHNEPVIGTFCRLAPIKGLDLFVEAAAELIKRSYRVRFVIGGSGPEKDRLVQLSESLGLKDKLGFPGFVDDVYAWISSMDVFVISSLHEGFPTAALEAMALGVPVVATSVGGIPEIIEHRQTGVLVNPRDCTALADGIQLLLDDRKLRDDIGRHGMEMVRTKYSSESQAEKVIQCYENAKKRDL
jgi:glycosyltransferase involved in cell wall biosynthesis